MLPALIGISGHEVGAEEEAAIRRWQPAGFILFSRNIDSVEQVRGLTESLRKLCLHHPVIAVDQEGGRVVRTASLGLNLPSPASLARLGSVGGVVELGAVTALALRYLGVNLNFAPVLDICHDPSAANALPGRCWGDNAQDVISRGGVYASNLRRGGVSFLLFPPVLRQHILPSQRQLLLPYPYRLPEPLSSEAELPDAACSIP